MTHFWVPCARLVWFGLSKSGLMNKHIVVPYCARFSPDY